MKTIEMTVAENGQDLIDLPVGSRILTVQHQVMELDQIEEGRKDSGVKYWIQPGTLTPFPLPGIDWWFPALVLPADE